MSAAFCLICHGNTGLSEVTGRGQGEEVLCRVSLSLPGLSSIWIISRMRAVELFEPCPLRLTCLHQIMGGILIMSILVL